MEISKPKKQLFTVDVQVKGATVTTIDVSAETAQEAQGLASQSIMLKVNKLY